MTGDRDAIVLEGVEKRYRTGSVETTVLDRIDLTIARGEHVTLFGRSGSGKTTLLNLIGGLDRPSAGRIVAGGRDLTAASDRELTDYRRHEVGFVFQFFNLIPTLTALENVEVGLVGPRAEGESRRERATEWLGRVGLAHHAERFPSQLSGGEQQRVAVARALARQPAILLADEPTGNLDAANGAAVFELMTELQRAAGVTTVLVTHDRALAERTDRVIELTEA